MRSNRTNNLESFQGVNLDVNASWGLSLAVQQRLGELLSSHGLNPSSIHGQGQRARFLVEEARDAIRKLLNAPASAQVIFTSGATEANNLALLQPLLSGRTPSSYLTTAFEHPSVLEPLAFLSQRGWKGRRVKPSSEGTISPKQFVEEFSADNAIASLMLANNEIGSVLPVADVAKLIRSSNSSTLLHTDAVQALGKIELDFSALGVDMMAISGHKIGALSGIGALVVKEGVRIVPLLHGGPQEKHLRAGTENVLGIASFGIAAELVSQNLPGRIIEMERAARLIRSELSSGISDVHFWNNAPLQLPNTLSVHLPGINADDLVVALDLAGILVSSGSACASGKPDPSHVLLSLGIPESKARETIRISVGTQSSLEQYRLAAQSIIATVTRMRSRS